MCRPPPALIGTLSRRGMEPAMSADNNVPAFPAASYGSRALAFSAAAQSTRAAGAVVAYDGGPGLEARDMSPEQRAIRTAAIALLKAISACQCSVDSVILSVLAAAGAEADAVKADREVVKSVQVKAAAARAANGEYRAKKSGR